jgi:hypothetical protein
MVVTYQSPYAPYGAPLKRSTNPPDRLGCQGLSGGKTLTYVSFASVTKEKSFMKFSPGVNVIELFSFVTDDEAQ